MRVATNLARSESFIRNIANSLFNIRVARCHEFFIIFSARFTANIFDHIVYAEVLLQNVVTRDLQKKLN